MRRLAPRDSRIRVWPVKVGLVALAAGATLAALLATELAVRALFPEWAPRSARMTAFWEFHPRYGWVHVPDTAGRFSSVGFDVHVRINGKGFRGRDVSYDRQAGGRRITVLGDSHVWGFGVEEDETFCRVLERIVPGLEVVNLGVSGYSTDQELLLYRDEGARYETDLVVLVVSHNDLRGNTRTIESSVYGKPRFVLQGDELLLDNHPVAAPPRFKRLMFDLSGRSYLLTRTLRVLDHSRRAADVAVGAVAADDGRTKHRIDRSKPFPRTFPQTVLTRLLLEFARSVEARQPGAALMVVFADLRNGLGAQAVDFMREAGVSAVALDEIIQPMDPEWHLPDGLHWTAAAHHKVAEVLAGHLKPILAHTATRDRRAGASAPTARAEVLHTEKAAGQ